MVSLVIADDHTQDEYSEAKELFDLPVVTVSLKSQRICILYATHFLQIET